QSLRGINTTGCFKCGRTGHIKAECPLLKKDKAFTATWSGSEDEGDDDDEVTVHRSYMAIAEAAEEESETVSADMLSQRCLQVSMETSTWIMDSGCSHHMTGNKYLFSKLKLGNFGKVYFGDNNSA
ncbi:unnamed protein product, partial [Linum tenue]